MAISEAECQLVLLSALYYSTFPSHQFSPTMWVLERHLHYSHIYTRYIFTTTQRNVTLVSEI